MLVLLAQESMGLETAAIVYGAVGVVYRWKAVTFVILTTGRVINGTVHAVRGLAAVARSVPVFTTARKN